MTKKKFKRLKRKYLKAKKLRKEMKEARKKERFIKSLETKKLFKVDYGLQAFIIADNLEDAENLIPDNQPYCHPWKVMEYRINEAEVPEDPAYNVIYDVEDNDLYYSIYKYLQSGDIKEIFDLVSKNNKEGIVE